MLFGVLADAAEDSANIGAEAIDVAHRTHNGVLDAVGINKILPSPIKNLADLTYHTSQNIVTGTGQKTAAFLRNIDGSTRQHRGGEEGSAGNEDAGGSHSGGDAPGATNPSHPGHMGPYPSPPDARDHRYVPPDKPVGHHVDLREYCPPVYDQKNMMSCTAHAVAGAFEFNVIKQGLPPFEPSRLFLWYNARAKSDVPLAVKKNVGSNLRDAIKSLDFKAHGVCSETDWSYETGEYDKKTNLFHAGAKPAKKPPVLAEKHAHQHTATRYLAINGGEGLLTRLKKCLDEGHPFVFGMKTYGLLQNVGSDGHGLHFPTAKDKKNGDHTHSLLAVGYIESEKLFIVRNSWGSDWGLDGYFYMPYNYMQICYDFWTVRVVHSPPPKA